MATDDYRLLADERHNAVMRRLEEIHIDVRMQNSRVGKSEVAIAELAERVPDNLRDRLSTLEERAPGVKGGIFGTVGGIVGGFLAGLVK